MSRKGFFVYPATQPFNVIAGGRNTDSITINDQYAFMAYYIAAVAYVSPANTVLNNLLLLQLRVNNQNYFNTPVKIDLISGNGQNCNFLPVKILLRPHDKIMLDWQNIDAANPVNIFFCFIGYEFPQADLQSKPAKG